MKRFFTSESVTEGHPDKLCDYISDSILDACITEDKNSRVACETVAGKGEIYITGEITTTAKIDSVEIEKLARNAIKEVGYGNSELDIDPETCKVTVKISKQSPDIALGVNRDGAGDQGMMFGFACDETEELMPLPISLANKLAKRLADVRKQNIVENIRPDGKTQVTVEYDGDKPIRIDAVVISTQHEADVDLDKLKKELKKHVIDEVIPKDLLDENTKYFINPTGRFVIGGPLGDSGLTGRKIIVDTYGGYAKHGGGAFSGKDPTKVDRSAAYMARYVSKNIVASKLAKKCEIQLSYAIGVSEPVSILIDTFGTATIPEEEIVKKVYENFDLTPKVIIETLKLQEPIYKKTTNYGHFGKPDLAWEQVDKILS